VLGAHATVVAATFSMLLGAGCSPLVATVGVEDGERDHDASADAWVQPADAAGAHDAGGGADRDGGAAEPGDAQLTPPQTCVELPDLVGLIARTDGGVRALDSGVVWAAVDQDLGCAASAAASGVAAATTVTYGRVDGLPLMEAGRLWTLSWPRSGVSSSASLIGSSTSCGNGTDLPILIAALVFFPPVLDDDCVPGPAGAVQYLRLVVNTPTPFPSGLRLCDQSVCP
jgi:hypothetical protein